MSIYAIHYIDETRKHRAEQRRGRPLTREEVKTMGSSIRADGKSALDRLVVYVKQARNHVIIEELEVL